MDKNEIAFIIAAINIGGYKKISELRKELNSDNNCELFLLNYLDSLEYSSKACPTK